MSKMIFVNLPVRDLAKAKAFYEAIGAVNNPQFSDATSACMVVSDTIFVMLLTHDKWAFFTKKPIADSRNASEAMLAISCDTRQAVDTMTDAAAAHGGKADINPKLASCMAAALKTRTGTSGSRFFMDMSQMPKGA